MKRSLYIAFIAATTFSIAACTKQIIAPTPQVPDASRSYIFFEPEVVTSDNTKATILTGETLPTAVGTAFGVIGYHGTISLFGAPTPSNKGIAQVARSVDGVFEYSPLAAWQGADNHDFYAFYPYNLNAYVSHNVNNTTNLANPYITYSQPTANDATMVDLLTAKTSVTKAAGDEVAIKFYHRLWALDVKIKNSMTKGIAADGKTEVNNPSVTITKIELYVKDFPQTAVIPLDPNVTNNPITYGTETMTPSTPYEIPVPSADKTIAYNQTKSYGTLFFIPLTSSQKFIYRLVISYTDSMGSGSFTYPKTGYKESSGTFEGGKKYTLTLDKTNDTFVIGTYFDPDDERTDFQPGDWSDANVNHEFN